VSANHPSTEPAQEDPEPAGGPDGAEAGADGDGGNIAGEFTTTGPIEPGSPSLEHALVVIAGAFIAVLALGELLLNSSSLWGYPYLVLTAVMAATSLLALAYFGLLTPDT
jgi:hypothetical protein